MFNVIAFPGVGKTFDTIVGPYDITLAPKLRLRWIIASGGIIKIPRAGGPYRAIQADLTSVLEKGDLAENNYAAQRAAAQMALVATVIEMNAHYGLDRWPAAQWGAAAALAESVTGIASDSPSIWPEGTFTPASPDVPSAVEQLGAKMVEIYNVGARLIDGKPELKAIKLHSIHEVGVLAGRISLSGPLKSGGLAMDDKDLRTIIGAKVALRSISMWPRLQSVKPDTTDRTQLNHAIAKALNKVAAIFAVLGVQAHVTTGCFYASMLDHELVKTALTQMAKQLEVEVVMKRLEFYLNMLDLFNLRVELGKAWGGHTAVYNGVTATERLLPNGLFASLLDLLRVQQPIAVTNGWAAYNKPRPLTYEEPTAPLLIPQVPANYAPSGTWRNVFHTIAAAILTGATDAVASLEGSNPLTRLLNQFIARHGSTYIAEAFGSLKSSEALGDYSAAESADYTPIILAAGAASSDAPRDIGHILDRPIVPSRMGDHTAAQVARLGAIFASDLGARLIKRKAYVVRREPVAFIRYALPDLYRHEYVSTVPPFLYELCPKAYAEDGPTATAETIDAHGLDKLLAKDEDMGSVQAFEMVRRSAVSLKVFAQATQLIGTVFEAAKPATDKDPIIPLTAAAIHAFLTGTVPTSLIIRAAAPVTPDVGWTKRFGMTYDADALILLHQNVSADRAPGLVYLNDAETVAFLPYSHVPVPPRIDAVNMIPTENGTVNDPLRFMQRPKGRLADWDYIPTLGIVRVPTIDSRTMMMLSVGAGFRFTSGVVILMDASSTPRDPRLIGIADNNALLMNSVDIDVIPSLTPWMPVAPVLGTEAITEKERYGAAFWFSKDLATLY